MAEPVENLFELNLPSQVVPGVFADFASVWHTPNVFVLDFVALAQPPTEAPNSTPERPKLILPGQVVSRIRIPPEQVFEVAKALTQQLEMWEQETGKKPPAAPLFPNPPAPEPRSDEETDE